MTERKAKQGISALLIVGLVFTGIGAIYLAVGIIISLWEKNMLVFLISFGGIGLVFLIAGIICLLLEIRKRKRRNRLLNAGRYITAEITEVSISYAIKINRRYPYVVICRYEDGEGNVHLFKSRYLLFDPAPFLKDRMVRVYVEDGNFKHYYVDIDEVLPNVVMH